MRESTIEKYLIKRVKELGGTVKKQRWIGCRGAPDRLVLFPRSLGLRSFFIELKAPGKKLNKSQLNAQTELRAAGFICVCWDQLTHIDNMHITMKR